MLSFSGPPPLSYQESHHGKQMGPYSLLCQRGQVLQSISSPVWSVTQKPRQGGRVTPEHHFRLKTLNLLQSNK